VAGDENENSSLKKVELRERKRLKTRGGLFIKRRLLLAIQSIALLLSVFVFEVCFDQLFCSTLSDRVLPNRNY
jgi:hypothetical protein